jgi:UDPglucose 6-dehydrogenase
MNLMKISVIGAGYVGLTTAACLAEIGHNVCCADNDERKLNLLRAGNVPFFESHLERLISESRKAGRLRFDSTETAVADSEAIFICVGTPPLDNGEADLSAVDNVARIIGQRASGDVTKVAMGMGMDPRIGSAFLSPGVGFGGFCLPKDVQAFVRIAEKAG